MKLFRSKFSSAAPTIVDLCLNINIAKESCYGSFKLKMSYNVYYYVYCYIILYWPPPLAMDAVSATIFAAGQAQLMNMQCSIEIN
jgi:hypothetical protein